MKVTRLIIIVIIALTSADALSQPAPPQVPSQIALQLNQVIISWAQALESQQKQIEALTKERDGLKAQLEKKDAK